jgi:hypothetical protein
MDRERSGGSSYDRDRGPCTQDKPMMKEGMGDKPMMHHRMHMQMHQHYHHHMMKKPMMDKKM